MYNTRGFTLIEVMIVVVILGILAAIAFPSYQQYVIRGNRTEGMALLNDAAARQERYFSQNNAYASTAIKLGLPAVSANRLYALSVTADSESYKLAATPQGSQARDTTCGKLTLNSLGERGQDVKGSTSECWR
jgi:type IV pilus assembly protein PilE